ncbi:MAG: hypothetical protein FWG65_12480 [Turicibacter sp.]|nr:hypothetical protein [Turicibacter sp.]
MRNSVPGHGAVSIVLIFTVLCLTILAVVSLNQALTDRGLAVAAQSVVVGYYEADALAERVLANLNPTLSQQTVLGVDVQIVDGVATFDVPIHEYIYLIVEAELGGSILVWRMENTADWTPDFSLPIWTGS